MHKELKEVDIQRMARGSWDDYFRTRFHPKVRTPWLIALITFITAIALVVAIAVDVVGTPSAGTGPGAVSMVTVGLLLTTAGFFLKGFFTVGAERERFIEHSVSEWHEGKGTLPDGDTVHTFVLNRGESQ